MTDLYGGLSNHPQFMLSRKEWEPKKGKYIKKPCNITGYNHDTTDKTAWLPLPAAQKAANTLGELYGVGFALCEEDSYFFLDIDDCLVNGQWSPLAMKLINMFPGAYVEVSVGGTGLHIIGSTSIDIPHTCRNNIESIEFYTSGRLITLGNVDTARGSADTIHNEAVQQLVNEYFDPTNAITGTSAKNDEWTTTHAANSNPILNDDVLVKKASRSASGSSVFGGNSSATFNELWTASESLGNYYPADNDGDDFNRSTADSALATHLMFWTGGDCERTKRLMIASELNRDKFERDDYMLWTILGAKRIHLSGGGDYYSMTDEVVEYHEPCEAAVKISEDIATRMSWIVTGMLKGTTEESREVVFNINTYAIDQIITRSFWSGTKSKLFILTDDNTLNMFVEKDMFRIAEKYFGTLIDNAELDFYATVAVETMASGTASDVVKTLSAVAHSVLVDYLKMKNQRDRLRSKVDMFATRPRMEWSSDSVTNVFVWNKVPALGAPDQNIVDDYMKHFPMFDPLIQQIVAARFASDRKNAFTWLRADSDWGKGVFTSALKDLGLLVELSVAETEKAFEGAPMSKDAQLFTHAFVVCFNEFKMVKSELKQIENELPISPKNQLMQIVDIYHKLFTSAESVDSLVGEAGVEDQFANRFSYIDGRGSIAQRSVFVTEGKYRYFMSVKQHMAMRVNELVNEYIQLGEDTARIEADKFLDKFHSQYGIGQTFERISQNLPMIVQSFKEWVVKAHAAPFNGGETYLYKDETHYYLKSAAKIFADWLDETASRSERITLSKKKGDVMHMLSNGEGVRSNRVRGDVVKSVRFTL